jgi:hypothetical protein
VRLSLLGARGRGGAFDLKGFCNWPIAQEEARASSLPEPVVTRALLLSFVASMCVGCASTDTTAPAFKAGDIAVARNFTHYPHLNGTHVLVTGDYEWRWIKGGNTLKCYAVKTVDGQELAAQTFQLQPVSAQASL